MNRSIFGLITLLAAIIPAVASAQENVKAAFEAIINSSDTKIKESHNLQKDPQTGLKNAQCDIYRFELPSSKKNLIDNVIKAFRKDNDNAYQVYCGTQADKDVAILIAVGDASGSGPQISEPGREYYCALFLAPLSEDPEGIYRYAYAINWEEGNGKIEGKLIVTYATTLQHRQQQEKERQLKYLGNYPSGTVIIKQGGDWLEKIMTPLMAIPEASEQTKISLAMKAYKYIRDIDQFKNIKPSDKEAVREIIKTLEFETKSKDSMLRTILQRCLVELK